MVRTLVFILIAAVIGVPAAARVPEVSLEVSARQTYVNEAVTVQITVSDAEDVGGPEPPEIDGATLRVVGSSIERSYTSIINGRMNRTVSKIYRLELIPTRAGTIRVPPIPVRVDGEIEYTGPFNIVAVKSETGSLLFVEVQGDRESLYVGEPVDLTLQIWIKPYAQRRPQIDLNATSMFSLIQFDRCEWGAFKADIDELLRSDAVPGGTRVIREDAEGQRREYFLYELKKTVWPEQPGPWILDDIRVVLKYPLQLRPSIWSFTSQVEITRSRIITAAANMKPIEVMEIPTQDRPPSYRGAVGTMSLDVAAKPTEVRVGDPITLTMTIRGEGRTRLDLLRAPDLASVPELTEGFQVPRESELAGTIGDGVKRFTQSIFPKNDQVTEIPSIPLAYFDPAAGKFETVHSDPIPITVEPAQRMRISQVVQGEPVAPAPTLLTEVAGGIVANYYDAEEVLADQGFAPGPVEAATAATPPALYLLCWVLLRRRQRLRQDRGLARRRSARRNAMHALQQATGTQAAERVAGALLGYVADRCNLPTGGMTRADVRTVLGQAGVPGEIIARADALLGACDDIRYAGSADGKTDNLVTDARQCIRALERQRF